MRAVLLTACVWLWVSPALAQTPAIAGATYSVSADHDGADTADYVLRDGSAVLATRTDWANGVITFPGAFVAIEGSHSLTISARNANGEALSEPLLVMVQAAPPPAPTLGPCPYTSPAGVSSTKPIGDTTVQGWNTYDFTKLADIQKFGAKVQQLVQWGFTVAVTQFNKPKNQVYFIATCVGIVAAAPAPPPVTRLVMPPLTSLTDASGDVWTMAGMSLIRNGVASGGMASQMVLTGGQLYALGGDGRWWLWTGNASTLPGVNLWVFYSMTAP